MTNEKTLTNRRKALAKCVDVKHVRDWIPEPDRRRVAVRAAWTIIKNHYCAALVGRGVCPITCGSCREAITSMFDLVDAKNPEALLTWRAKDRGAARIEALIASEKAFPALENAAHSLENLFPTRKAGNLFLDLDADYA